MAGPRAWLLLHLLALPLVPGAPSVLPDTGTGTDTDTGMAQAVLRPHQPGNHHVQHSDEDSQTHDAPQRRRRLQGRFLHITDFHPDELYTPHSSTEQGIACHRKKGHAGAYGAEKTDCDSPLSLVNATLDWIRDNLRDDIDFIIWTGDSARHDSDEKHPRDSDEVVRTNSLIADKFIDTVATHSGELAVPVIPTFGNNDFLPHNIFYPGPNKWLHTYSDVWRRFIPEAQRHSFAFGGWFYVEVIPARLAVFSLNTMYFFDRNAGVDGCQKPSEPGFKHMEWLRIQLQQMRDRGMKAILTGHVPPARTRGKQNWDETCWQKYTLWLRQYRDVVTGSVFGHMNIDHFLLQDTRDIDIVAGSRTRRHETAPKNRVHVGSKGDYLQELRSVWSNLPAGAVGSLLAADAQEASATGRKHKHGGKKYRKIHGKYAERYQLSLVSPSVVPNYFPTLRVVEYNISGLGDAETWVDPSAAGSENRQLARGEHVADVQESAISVFAPEDDDDDDDDDDEEDDDSVETARGKKKKGKKGRKGKKGKKGKKPKKPADPNLTVPDDPPKSSLPGPAYLMQPFTFTGYTQYFANLTHINNNNYEDDASAVGPLGWRDGDHGANKPGSEPRPRAFTYEVEYSTFDDKVYRLPDLTVKSYVKLAYRIAKQMSGKAAEGLEAVEDGDDEGVFDDDDEDDEDFEDDDDVAEAEDAEEADLDITGKKKKKKKEKRRKKHNKVWMHFLDNAFVRTVSKKERRKM